LQAWQVPDPPPEYFTDPRQWWNQDGHYGHGPFDLLTPRLAEELMRTGASDAICGTLSSLLPAVAANASR